MVLRRYLADKFTPAFLMDLCDGLTGFQAADVVYPFLGRWIRVRGTLFQATPNPAFGTAGVTIELPNDGKYRREAFLTFTEDLDGLGAIGRDEPICAEGQIKSVTSNSLVLENCGLTDPRIASTLMVTAAAEELRIAAEEIIARRAAKDPATWESATPEAKPRKADARKNLSPAEMERFCKILLEMWPNTTEREAHPKAVAFFKDNKVPVKAFLDLFRPIRGHSNPGPRPKTRD